MAELPPTDFPLRAGDDHKLRFTVADPDGDLATIAGATIKWKLSNAKESTSHHVEKQTGGQGIEILDAVARVFEVTLVSADTADLNGEYYHEARLQTGGGQGKCVAWGTASIPGTTNV